MAKWSEMEAAVCDAANMAFMLEATIETETGADDGRKRSAITYGVYELAELCRTAVDTYYELHEEVRKP
jgi:hypothetical protein